MGVAIADLYGVSAHLHGLIYQYIFQAFLLNGNLRIRRMATMLAVCLGSMVTMIKAHAQSASSFAVLNIHNPAEVEVKEIHMILSSHFDGGCKTPGCGQLVEGEPDLCAKVGPHWAVDPAHTGEPYNYHIINRYFDKFLYDAVQRAEQLRNTSTPYTYMTQSWVLALMLDCQNTGVLGIRDYVTAGVV